MTTKRKTVTGSGEKLKAIKNAKSASKTAIGGTSRPRFTGSNDTRAAGSVTSNEKLKRSVGYADSGPVSMGDTSHSRKFTKAGSKGSLAGAVTPAKEKVTNGMGGKFIKKMK